jgi:4-alpha-glucanotransferase
VLRRKYPAPWTEWPRPWRSPDRDQLRRFRRANQEDCEFHEFMQWIADRQLGACAEAARRHRMPIGLYIDLAVGIDRHGADAWSQQGAVLADISMGAPPDQFNPGGQDWGLAPLNPHTTSNDDFKSMRLMMRAAMRHAGAVRLDHVLGLQRVFMIPLGRGAVDGAYVRFPFHHLLRVIAEESRRLQCVVIGEDLGTVPENFRETLVRWGLWCYRVMLFERENDGRFRPPDAYPAGAVATFSTHDLPTFRGWLEMHDLAVKRGIGVDPGEGDDARAWAHKKLHEILSERAPAWRNYEIAAVAAFLAQTPSRLVVMSIEDMLGERDQVNIPGTTDQHPNWRRKLPVLLEELGQQEDFRHVVEAFEKGGRRF